MTLIAQTMEFEAGQKSMTVKEEEERIKHEDDETICISAQIYKGGERFLEIRKDATVGQCFFIVFALALVPSCFCCCFRLRC